MTNNQRIGNIYIDPFKINNEEISARYIFITHSHYDHFSIEDIEKIVNEDTIFVATKDVAEKTKKVFANKVVVVEPNKTYIDENLLFYTFPSYNINKNFHPKGNDWVGYVIQVDGVKYAVLGDSDCTDDVKRVKCDVLFVPIGGTYTMEAEEASELTNIINPKLVIPVHYNGIVGDKKDEKKFLSGLNKGIKYKLFM